MHFHFILSRKRPLDLARIEPFVAFISAGLKEMGHRITADFDGKMLERPVVNLLVEPIDIANAAERMGVLTAQSASRYCVGLVCPSDIEDSWFVGGDDAAQSLRIHAVKSLARHLAFAWPLVPGAFSSLADCKSVEFLKLGYCNALRRDAHLERDIDVVFFGDISRRRGHFLSELARSGLRVEATLGVAPDYLRFEMLDRARLVVELRMTETTRFLPLDSLIAELHSGVAIVCERYDGSALGSFYDYVIPVEARDVVVACHELLRSGRSAGQGVSARAAFSCETSMASSLRNAMNSSGLVRAAG